jgi:hypothetical protein
MVSKAAISRDWHVSRPYVSRCVNHRGCPTGSLQEARVWRDLNARKRPPTNPKSIARATEDQGDNNSAEDSILIPLATAKDIAFRGYDFIFDLVDRLPKNTAAGCNPSNPQIALAVLESECTYILCNAGEAYDAWSKIGPDISTTTLRLPRPDIKLNSTTTRRQLLAAGTLRLADG